MARLALFLPDMRGGGAERVALTLVQGFIEQGHQVDLVVMHRSGDLMDLVPEPVRVIDLDAPRVRNSVLPLAAYLKRHRPDALMALMWPLTIVAILARVLARVSSRIVTSDHAILSEHYANRQGTLSALRLSSRLLYPKADARIVPSIAIAKDLEELSGLDRGAFTVIPNPVSVPVEPISSGDEAALLWGNSGIRILSVGALKPEKNHAILLRAFAQVAAIHDARLVILGEGALRKELEALALDLGISDRITMAGFRSDPWPFYANATLFVLSSDTEGFGNVLVEAMASGLPIVSTDSQGAREILEDGKWGRLVPVGDPLALAVGIEQTLAEPADGKLLKSRAGRHASDKIAEAYLEAMTGLGKMGAVP